MTDDFASSPSYGDAADGSGGPPQMHVLAQYIKDLSFENPGAATEHKGGKAPPAIDFGIDVQGRQAPDGAYEVELTLEAKATRDGKPVFIAELKYGGLFQFMNVPTDMVEPLLLVECPRMLFPFARRVMADITSDGGFPPLFIDPIDFAGLYNRQKDDKKVEGGDAKLKVTGDGGSAA